MDFSQLDASILFEDDALLVLNKPAGWVVNTSESYDHNTIQDWMEQRLGEKLWTEDEKKHSEHDDEFGTPEEVFHNRGGIVHRLDKDTSGILILAKTPTVLVDLLKQFRERTVHKEYTALIHGKLSPDHGIIRLPMGRSREDRKKFAVSVGGRLSETHYDVQEYFANRPEGISEKKGKSYQGFTLVRLTPKTGRTHQIRVHMAALKHPLVGDKTYAGRKRIEIDKEWCPRQFLHASEIDFVHPLTKENLHFDAPLADDLQAALRFLSS